MSQRLDFIDSLRGWAVLGVVAVHSNALIIDSLPDAFKAISSAGARGVQLFFILSAFSLFYSLERRRVKNKNDNYITFVTRRFFRISPMFYTAILLYGMGALHVLYPSIHTEVFYSAGNFLSHITYLHGFWPNYVNTLVPGGWSIATEMIFYLFVPLLFTKIKNLTSALWFLVFSICLNLVITLISILSIRPRYFTASIWGDFIFFLLPQQLVAFALGIILYMLFVHKHNNTNAKPLLALGFATAVLMLFNGMYQNVWFSIPLFFIALALSMKPIRFFVNKYMSFLGTISFSVYLLHFIIVPGVSNFITSAFPYIPSGKVAVLLWVEIVAVTVLLTVPLAYITYRYIERPGIELGNRIITRITKSATV